MPDVDIAVIGAGPAGLAAAVEASSSATVALIDMNPRLGGQYWRHSQADEAGNAARPPWHHGWSTYLSLADGVRDGLRRGTIHHLPSTQVWALDRTAVGFTVHTTAVQGTATRTLSAARVILATGTHDRHLPIPGWTLPGVMAAGGIQAYIKSQGTAPGRRTVLAGTGPFLLAAADTILRAGSDVVAVLESSSLRGWVPGAVIGAAVPGKGIEGAEYAVRLARHGVPYLRRHVVAEIHGGGRVEAVTAVRVDEQGSTIPGTERRFEDVDLVGLGWGFTPQLELLDQLGAATRLDVDGSLIGVVDDRLSSTVPGLLLAGELTGVKGAMGAVADGRIAGRAATGRSPRRQDLFARRRHAAFARVMHRAHPVPDVAAWTGRMTADTVVCRCEEVSWDEVRTARDELDTTDPRSLKGATRVGMGYCQGRICGFAAQCLASSCSQLDAARAVTRRPLGAPITLAELGGQD